MDTIKVLKRRDGAALVVGVVVAFIIISLLTTVTTYISSWASGLGYGKFGMAFPGTGWKGQYLHPVISTIVQLLALEILIKLYIIVHSMVTKK